MNTAKRLCGSSVWCESQKPSNILNGIGTCKRSGYETEEK
jgi:hypothetical protein